MIPKASQRGGGQQLATHLLNEFDNDRVEVAHVRGAISPDLHGAFAEWRAVSHATQCLKYLYSLSLNPDPRQGPLTRDQYLDFIARAEKALGLGDQPRAVVFHVKYGREHCHVVWSRIDGEKLKAVQLSHDHQNLRTITREFARDHKLRLPPGLSQDKGAERFKDRARRENLTEQQQQERSGITKQERMTAITRVWKETRSASDLVAGLEREGYLLARGDRRTYVVVDIAGEIHSLARQIENVKPRQVKARLAEYPVERLPDAKAAQAFVRNKRTAQRGQDELKDARSEKARQPPDRDPAQALRDELTRRQAVRRAGLSAQKDALGRQHKLEADTLRKAQRFENADVQHAREAAKPGTVMAFLMRITGFGRLVETRHKRQDAHRAEDHARQREALERRHHREMVDFRHREHALSSVEARERRSLETRVRREAFARAAGRTKDQAREAVHDLLRDMTPAQRCTLQRVSRDAQDITRPLSGARARGALSHLFNDPGKKPEAPRGGKNTEGPARDDLASRFNEEAARTRDTEAEARARELWDEFRKRAGAADKDRDGEGRGRKPRGPGRDRDR